MNDIHGKPLIIGDTVRILRKISPGYPNIGNVEIIFAFTNDNQACEVGTRYSFIFFSDEIEKYYKKDCPKYMKKL